MITIEQFQGAVATATSLPVAGALVVAVVLAFGLWRFVRPPGPAALIWGPAVVIGGLIGGHDVGRYLGEPIRGFRRGSLVPIGLALLLYIGSLAVAAIGPKRRGDRSLADDNTAHLAIAAVGITLCVPETHGLLRVIAPLVVAAAAVRLGWVRPSSAPELVAAATFLALISVVDGQCRGSAVVGASACLAAAGLMGLWSGRSLAPSGDGSRRSDRWVELAIFSATVLICSRVAVVHGSLWPAVAVSVAALVGGPVVLLVWDRASRGAPGAPGAAG
jgi:hypothetical protein